MLEPVEKIWMEPVTENPAVGATEVWEFYNTTGDAHPMHVHEVVFEVVVDGLPDLGPVETEVGVESAVFSGDDRVTSRARRRSGPPGFLRGTADPDRDEPLRPRVL